MSKVALRGGNACDLVIVILSVARSRVAGSDGGSGSGICRASAGYASNVRLNHDRER